MATSNLGSTLSHGKARITEVNEIFGMHGAMRYSIPQEPVGKAVWDDKTQTLVPIDAKAQEPDDTCHFTRTYDPPYSQNDCD